VHAFKRIYLPKMENQQTKFMGLEVETHKQCKTMNNYPTTHGNAQKTQKRI
jgi:hypothetical protein